MHPSAALLFDRVLKPVYVTFRDGFGELVFERRYGIQTSEASVIRAIGAPERRRGPASWTGLWRILPRREVDADDVFLDIGAGAGRIVFLAARYPFRRVVGIELDDRLTAIARANIARARGRLRCPEIELATADATTFEVPPDVTVVYLNNPFVGEVFRAAIGQLLASHARTPRRIRLIYFNPIEHDYLLSTGRFRPIRLLRGLRPGAEWSRSNSGRLYELV